jgi:drug/metabolite transporter (DMT)-like permease
MRKYRPFSAACRTGNFDPRGTFALAQRQSAVILRTVVIWGSTWIAIAMQVGPVPVLVLVFYRFVVAALVLIIALVVTRRLETPALRHQPFLIAQAICLFSFNSSASTPPRRT